MAADTATAPSPPTTNEGGLYNVKFYPQPAPVSKKQERPFDEIDYRSQKGPKLSYLWCRDDKGKSLLTGQTLYLGGEVASDECIYYIPGHAPHVLKLDPQTDTLKRIGPSFAGKFKWLRGVVVGDCIYGLPCHAESVLKINVTTQEVTTIDIPYEDLYGTEAIPDAPTEGSTISLAQQQRKQEWKYHGGNISPVDGCIYGIPQSALHVLKIDPCTDTCELVGPPLPGRWKWYGGVIGKTDGALYGIPHDANSILRVHPTAGVSLHGNFGQGGHKWHGAAAAPNGTIVCVPANADAVLNIVPAVGVDGAPTWYECGNADLIQTGRHRKDKKYKYLGAMGGSDGMVYVFPSGSERVLQVDTSGNAQPLSVEDARSTTVVKNVGPNIYDAQLERICQNKWQNGVVAPKEECVYAIPLAAESLLRIDCGKASSLPQITTWPLPAPYKGLGKFEGAVVAPNGIMYTVPNNHKAVLRIEPYGWAEKQAQQGIPAEEDLVYKSGIPTLRSSSHRVKFNPKSRKHDPKPLNRAGKETGADWLPPAVLSEWVLDYDAPGAVNHYEMFRGAIGNLLQGCESEIVGSFRGGSQRLEDFVVPVPSLWRSVNGGRCEDAQQYLSERLSSDKVFLHVFDNFVCRVVLPKLKRRLVEHGAVDEAEESGITFYYQRPPTLRLQPGPGRAIVNVHHDGEYGHQNGELNFWIPLTDRSYNGVDLWCESSHMVGDYHPVVAKPGQLVAFHGSSCRHYVNANTTQYTRVSLDFRVGVEGYYDPAWQMRGTTHDHDRRQVSL